MMMGFLNDESFTLLRALAIGVGVITSLGTLIFKIIIGYPRLLRQWSLYKQRRLKNREKAISCDYLDDESKDVIQEEIAMEMFYISEKIRCTPEIRKYISRKIKEAEGGLTMKQFSYAYRFMKDPDSPTKIIITRRDRFFYFTLNMWLYKIFTGLCLIYFTGSILLMFKGEQSLAIGFLVFAVAMLISSLIFYASSIPVSIAMRVKEQIEPNSDAAN